MTLVAVPLRARFTVVADVLSGSTYRVDEGSAAVLAAVDRADAMLAVREGLMVMLKVRTFSSSSRR
ncbi:hypothetical protein BI311_24960 [Xanthomonas citri pv. citri]|nr:hypothetical protein BI311_24960 [Xanthomonas citri pv. citri]